MSLPRRRAADEERRQPAPRQVEILGPVLGDVGGRQPEFGQDRLPAVEPNKGRRGVGDHVRRRHEQAAGQPGYFPEECAVARRVEVREGAVVRRPGHALDQVKMGGEGYIRRQQHPQVRVGEQLPHRPGGTRDEHDQGMPRSLCVCRLVRHFGCFRQ